MLKKPKLNSYANNCSGQFSVIFAIAVSVVMLGTAAAIDVSELHKAEAQLNSIADAAALAGAAASEQSKSSRVQVVKDYITQNSDEKILSLMSGQPVIKFDDASQEVTVAFEISTPPIFDKVLNRKEVSVRTQSVVSYGLQNISDVTIALALDVSGSMDWKTTDGRKKILTLKDSVKLLFKEIEAELDNSSQLNTKMRTSMSAYNTSLGARSPMNWGWGKLDSDISRLSAGGGTNSTPSLKYAYNQILNDRQYRKKNDPSYNYSQAKEFVVFMTDGDNNQDVWDDRSYKVCTKMHQDGIEVYSIAFAAPGKGQALLMDCASSDNGPRASLTETTCRGDILGAAQNADAGMQRCRELIMPKKDGHYFDAEDSAAFQKTFKNIGREIVERGIRIKS